MPSIRLVVIALFAAIVPSVSIAGEAGRIDFNRDVRPILSEKCFACHGFDKNKRKAGLRLDTRDPACSRPRSPMRRPPWSPGKPDESELIDRVTSDQDDRSACRRRPSRGQDAHAEASRDPPPVGRRGGRVEGALGVSSAGEARGPEGRRRTSASSPGRRVHPRETQGRGAGTLARGRSGDPDPPVVVRPDRPAALRPTRSARSSTTTARTPTSGWSIACWPPRIIGEAMAARWLDLVRFADTIGYHSDNNRNVWPYRDYVIDSFNRNVPFDRNSPSSNWPATSCATPGSARRWLRATTTCSRRPRRAARRPRNTPRSMPPTG